MVGAAARFNPPPPELGSLLARFSHGNPRDVCRLMGQLVDSVQIESLQMPSRLKEFRQWVDEGAEKPPPAPPKLVRQTTSTRTRPRPDLLPPPTPLPARPQLLSAVPPAPPRPPLTSLNERERLIVDAVGMFQPVSPSDPRLLERFGFTRSRLSQILNDLNRRGQLEVETISRRRCYRLPG